MSQLHNSTTSAHLIVNITQSREVKAMRKVTEAKREKNISETLT